MRCIAISSIASMADKYHFTTDESIELWIKDHAEQGGLEFLEKQLKLGHINSPRNKLAQEYIDRMRMRWMGQTDRAAYDLNRRAVDAAEASARATEEATAASKTSARCAVFAAIVSSLALIVSLAPYMRG